MFSNPEPQPRSILKNPLLYSSIAVAVAAVVVGWIFVSRWQENRQIERQAARESARKQSESDRRALEQMGGKDLAIQALYAIPEVIHPGQKSQLCYSVANEKTVKLEPQASPVWPSYSRCVDVSPTRDTTYTLTIQDAAGNTKSQTVDVKVR
jgi:hypothetical protein